MRLFLLRHTEVDLPAGICYGRSDVALDPAWPGRFAATLAKLPDGVARAAPVYSSPLSRCLLLARSLGRPVTADERLRELDFGDWEMTPWDGIGAAAVDAWAAAGAHGAAPGGERLLDLFERAGRFADDLDAAGVGEALVVTHGGVIRCLLARALGLSAAGAFRLQVDYGSVSLVNKARRGWRVDYANR